MIWKSIFLGFGVGVGLQVFQIFVGVITIIYKKGWQSNK